MKLRIIAITAIMLFTVVRACFGQVTGRVVNQADQPINGALVQLIDLNGVAAEQPTDSQGIFHFALAASATANTIRVSHVGMTTAVVAVTATGRPVTVRLEVDPITLAPVAALDIKAECPAPSQMEARLLWEAASSKYSASTWARGLTVQYLYAERSVDSPAEIGGIRDSELQPRSATYVGATNTPTNGRYLNINQQFATEGYAVRTGHERPYWRYPSLEGRHAHHFGSIEFGSTHSFTIVDNTDDSIVLGFCPTLDRFTTIQGTLVISTDTTFVSAEWKYLHVERPEVAGGRVVFVSTKHGDVAPDKRHLLAAHGLLWYKHWSMDDRFTQRRSVYTDWTISESDEFPIQISGHEQ